MKDTKNVCEENTFNSIYKQYGEAIWRFIYYKCGDKSQAEDLVQDAFVKLWKNCAKVPFKKAKSYLYTITNNAFLNEVAHKKVVLKYQSNTSDTINIQSPEYILQEKQFKEKLENAIADLTEAQRTAFLLNRIEGKKYKEIAEILNISVKAVEKRMSQALAALREKIENI